MTIMSNGDFRKLMNATMRLSAPCRKCGRPIQFEGGANLARDSGIHGSVVQCSTCRSVYTVDVGVDRLMLVADVTADYPAGTPPRHPLFNPPPGWLAPPPNWTPPAGWQPDPSWPTPPPDWQVWVPGRFNPPPGWPPPPPDWEPPAQWRPDPSWPPAPPDWPFWVPAAASLPETENPAPTHGGPIRFGPDGKVRAIDTPPGTWQLKQSGQSLYYTQRARSLLQATQLLLAVPSIPAMTYYAVDTPDGTLCRDTLGLYTEAHIKTEGLALDTPTPPDATVEAASLTCYGDQPMQCQASVANLKQAGHYANFVLLMECGHCGYKSPVETQAGDMSRQCYCCGAINTAGRATINVFTDKGMVQI